MTDTVNHTNQQTNQTEVTRASLAKRLGCSYSTMRKYEREFAGWLKTPKGKSSQGTARVYLPEDVTILTAVHGLRLEGFSFKELKNGKLENALTTRTWTHNPEDFQPEDAPGEETQANALLLTTEQQIALMGKYQANEGKLAAVTDERDRLLEELEDTRERLLAAEKSASRAEGELVAYKSNWWRNLFKKNE